MNSLSDDEEIKSVLKNRTTPELIAFRDKLRKMNTPRAWAIRFYIIRELLSRYIANPPEVRS